jgi:signal transduction histidine kinase/ligand-binding sensor domain-containing protein
VDQRLPSDNIFSLLVTRDGTLWIGTTKGLASWKDGRLSEFPDLAGQYIFSLVEDREGVLWVGAMSIPTGKLCSIQNGSVKCYGQDGALGRGVLRLFEDSKSNLWVGVTTGIWSWKPDQPKFYPLPGEANGIRVMGEDSDGAVLVGWNGGIQLLNDGKTQPYPPTVNQRKFRAKHLIRDRDGGLWIGTLESGLVHVHQGKTDVFAPSEGLSGESVSTIFEDREGNIWVATVNGLDRFRDFTVATFGVNQGLSSDIVGSVLAARDGSIWVGTYGGLNRLNSGQKAFYSSGLTDKNAASLFQDSLDRIWVSTRRGIGYFENGRFVLIKDATDLNILGIDEDTQGTLWFANELSGLLHLSRERTLQEIPWSRLGHKDHVSSLVADRLRGGLWLGFHLGGIAYLGDGQIRVSYTAADGLGGGRVNHLRIDETGVLWAATDNGLSRLKDGNIATLSSRNGLPCDTVHWLISDNSGSLWLQMSCGLMRIARTELDAWYAAVAKNKSATPAIAVTVFDNSDGAWITSTGTHYSPPVTQTADGRLWIAGSAGIKVIDPQHLPFNKLTPPVSIEQFVADRKTYPVSSYANGSLLLPPLIRDLQIDYTALSLVAPEKILFRYKLEGYDKDWHDAGNRRQAFYTNLAPRKYRFRVMACNNSGVWNETGAFLDFTIAPAYYQTTWFRIALAAAFALVLATLYQLRLRQVAATVRGRMEERLAERERIARDLHDTFLQGVQGLILKFDAAAKQIPHHEPARQAMENALDRADEVIAEGRDRVRNLRDATASLSNLPAAFARVVEEYSQDGQVTFRSVVEGRLRELSPIVLEESYAIGREALINALTHSEGHNVEAEITYERRQFRLRIRDDGRGIDPRILKEGGRPDHFGLRGMRERADRIDAQLKLWSGVETGTEVELLIPAATAYRKINGRTKRPWLRFR